MQSTTLILLLGFMAISAFYFGRGRSLSLVGGPGHGKSHAVAGAGYASVNLDFYGVGTGGQDEKQAPLNFEGAFLLQELRHRVGVDPVALSHGRDGRQERVQRQGSGERNRRSAAAPTIPTGQSDAMGRRARRRRVSRPCSPLALRTHSKLGKCTT